MKRDQSKISEKKKKNHLHQTQLRQSKHICVNKIMSEYELVKKVTQKRTHNIFVYFELFSCVSSSKLPKYVTKKR